LRKRLGPWQTLERDGVGVHVGEWGAFNRAPHKVVLAWMEDCLDVWKSAGWGWALWNLRGAFGVMDSDRPDVNYENYQGHRLDREMLTLLQRF
jgi:endoglucanase